MKKCMHVAHSTAPHKVPSAKGRWKPNQITTLLFVPIHLHFQEKFTVWNKNSGNKMFDIISVEINEPDFMASNLLPVNHYEEVYLLH